MVIDRLIELRKRVGFDMPIREEFDIEIAKIVLKIANGRQGDVVGKNDTARLFVCLTKNNEALYIDYDAIDKKVASQS